MANLSDQVPVRFMLEPLRPCTPPLPHARIPPILTLFETSVPCDTKKACVSKKRQQDGLEAVMSHPNLREEKEEGRSVVDSSKKTQEIITDDGFKTPVDKKSTRRKAHISVDAELPLIASSEMAIY
eukprot:jgi/Bigna1/134687/aug1.26_g9395